MSLIPLAKAGVPGGRQQAANALSAGLYSLADRMPDELVLQTCCNAWAAALADAGLLFDSDRRGQNVSGVLQRLLGACGVIQRMRREVSCGDSAVAESFFATLKNQNAGHVYDIKASAD